ncbi:UNVERIFIED_CONTAM: 50S ribosomal protein L4 [Sesamum radiatum]|uniref:Large ribosomal subunit protein uL4m n=1 Tax=Sesamum radiatum TaxID=300843 RepID=A0AAW2M205_SESRA
MQGFRFWICSKYFPSALSISTPYSICLSIAAGILFPDYRYLFLPAALAMALSISRRVLRAFGSSDVSSLSFSLSNALHGHGFADSSYSKQSSVLGKAPFDAHRRFSTTILNPDSSEGSFPSHLLSSKRVLTPDREIGLYQDLVIPVTNFHNEDKGFMVLAGDVFDVPIRKDIIHRVVRWQLAKRQQGTHSTKTISEVSGTGRKPWRQKGTGRARHGTLRGAQFRGGATMHGPKPRSHAIKLNKKVRRLGLKIALSARAAEGKLTVFEDLEVPSHKTKNIVNYVHQMENTKKLLLVDGGPINEKLKLATQNLHYVNILPSIGLNVYSILLHDTLVMSRDAVNRIVERMHTPINR